MRPDIVDNKLFIRFYSCVDTNRGKNFDVDFIEKIIDNGNFESFINSLTKSFSCANNFGNCNQNYNVDKFDGVQVSLALGCNLSCSFCCAQELRNELIKNNYIKKCNELYYKVLNELAKCNFTKLRLTDQGEPLVLLETFEFLENIPNDSKIKYIHITTNGTLIDDRLINIIKKHPKIDFEIYISLNTYNKDSYKKLMGADKFDEIINRIDEIIKIENQIPNLTLKISFILAEEFVIKSENLFKLFNFISNKIKKEVRINFDYRLKKRKEYLDIIEIEMKSIEDFISKHNKKYSK